MNTKKTALVTGSGRGIGRQIALKLAQENYEVIVTGRNAEDVRAVCNEIKKSSGHATAHVGDLSTEAGLASLAAQTPRLDLLVTNIGSGKTTNDLVSSLEEWKRIFDINFFSAVLAVNHFLAHLEKSQGQIICISSIAGIEKITAPISYSVAKAALISYVKNCMRPLAEKKIRINCISPGNVWIENGSWENKMKQDPARVKDIIENQVALKKFVQPEDIADAVYFISLNESMTGQNMVVDAGQTRQN